MNPYREGVTNLCENQDLVQNFHNQKGPFDIVLCQNCPTFAIKVADIEGYSPVITSFVPTGTRNQWLVTKTAETQEALTPERGRTRAAGAGGLT